MPQPRPHEHGNGHKISAWIPLWQTHCTEGGLLAIQDWRFLELRLRDWFSRHRWWLDSLLAEGPQQQKVQVTTLRAERTSQMQAAPSPGVA
mmetsp:Transcript_32128/g.92370  ORF Transcript_32128/g.92370 Transcript_32128/m.92370 type:complete len:91 (-) Transcript_32128:283-555(-)